jgi:plasmid maintenance system antidote protein VapI
MNTRKENMEFDELIGSQEEVKLSNPDIELIRSHRKKVLGDRTEKDRINDILTALRFSLMRYLNSQDSDKIVMLGDYLVDLLNQLNIKRGVFAEYIEISPRNINKYFSGERKFTIDHALKLEQIFQIPAEIFLEVQVKNELIEAKRLSRKTYEKYDLNDLLAV